MEHIASVRPERDIAEGAVGVSVPSNPRPEKWTVLRCLTSETVQVGDVLVCAFIGDMILDSEPVAARALTAALGRRPVHATVEDALRHRLPHTAYPAPR
ncbi:hypothetical protein ACFVVA_19820 [Kitasatospora sp. NPDC058048]|uniref:hypothetical protein n=1 Tax=Kitasatospora sp. NPDC058048 TaxID=3346313 RepID=UPI0036DD672C